MPVSKIIGFIKGNPAAILFAVNAVVAMSVAWGWDASPGVTGAITTIATGLITIITAATTRPVGLQLILGAVATIATAFGAFGLHLDTARIGTGVTVLSIVLIAFLHLTHRPYVSAAAARRREMAAGAGNGGGAHR